MKIVYVGQLWHGGTCLMRMEAMISLGHAIIPIDTTPAELESDANALSTRISYHLGYPRDYSGVNKRLIETVQNNDGIDIIWVDKGTMLVSETLVKIKELAPCSRVVHYNPDDPFGGYGKAGWRRFLKTIPHYDLHFVPRYQNVEEYKNNGAGEIVFNVPTRGFAAPQLNKSKPFWGFVPAVHLPIKVTDEIRAKYGADIGFIGAFEKDRAEKILELARSGFKVRIFGEWPAKYLHKNINCNHKGVFGNDYVAAINSFKITLCFLRKNNRDQHTSRSIEIPACGAFMLAERTDEHLLLFKEGEEAAFFSDTEELIAKCLLYLGDDVLRNKVALAGFKRCHTSGYDYVSLLANMLEKAQNIK